MDPLERKLDNARLALQRFQEILKRPADDIVRDPKAVVRESQIAGLLTEAQAEAALGMMNDRNLTVYTYDEKKADELFSRLPDHAALIDAWLTAMRTGAAGL